MNDGATRLAPRPAARIPENRRERDALRRERMAAPLDFRSTGPTRPGDQLGDRPGDRPGVRPRPSTPRAAAPKRRPVLTAWGVLFAVTAPTTLAAALDAWLTGSIHWIFGLVFVASSFHAATLVRRRDLLAGVIVPPLAYCAGLLTAVHCGVLDSGRGIVNQLASLGALLALKPRPLFLGTGLAAALIAARWAGTRSSAKR